LKDLREGAQRGLKWDIKAALNAVDFFREVLVLNGGEFEGRPFELEGWQAFVVGSIYGWKREDGFRRYRIAYIETGKGSGKSPLAAGIGLKGLVADGEYRAEIYAAATKKDQAMILFRDAVAMVDQSPLLTDRITKSGSQGKEWNLAYLATDSFFRPIASEDGQSGPRPHVGLLDEVHEHKDKTVIEMMSAGRKGRRQPLIFMITNSGASKQSIGWEYHDYGTKVAGGMIENDSFFAYICALDKGDDPFKDRTCWIKANPSLGVTIREDYLEEQIREAQGIPSKEALVKRLNFCIWTEAVAPWILPAVWDGAKGECTDELLIGRRCWGGLDLSSTQDLTAYALAFEPCERDPVWRLKVWFWLPEEGLALKAERDKVEYPVWRNHGWLRTTPGRAISRLHVLMDMVNINGTYEVQEIGFDRWGTEEFEALIEQNGIQLPPLVAFGQGYKDMAPALNEFERRLLDRSMLHDGNPCLRWNAANAVTDSDPAGNRKVTKAKATGRVDGIVASIMATGRSVIGAVSDEGDLDDFLRNPIRT
jgi:phage terminase large subunit-like protein